MAKVQVQLAAAARKELFFALDSSSTTGAGKTGASGTMAAYYVRNETTPTATLITSPAFTEVSSGSMPGVYYLTVPLGAFAVGATTCVVMITGTGMAPVTMEYQLVAYNPDSATNLGLSALPTATHSTAGGLITSGTGTAQLTTASGVVTVGTINSGVITATSIDSNAITSAKIADTSLTAAKFGDSALVIGSAAAGGVKAYLDAGSITAGVIANAAIDAATFAAGAIDAAAIADSAITIRMSGDGTPSEGRIVAGSIATDVWSALVTAHTVAESFGARIIRTLLGTTVNQVTINASNHIAANVHQMQANVVNAAAVAADADEAIADAILNRNLAGGGNGTGATTDRTVCSALRALRNRSGIVGSTLTVYTEDDTATAWTAAVSTTAGANPVTGIDPAGP